MLSVVEEKEDEKLPGHNPARQGATKRASLTDLYVITPSSEGAIKGRICALTRELLHSGSSAVSSATALH